MSLQNLTDSFLRSLEGSRAQFTTSDLSPSREFDLSIMALADGSDKGVVGDSTLFKRTTVFGLVPVFSADGSVKIYIRFGGGPEILRKGQNFMDVEDSDDFFGPGAEAFQARYEDLDNSTTVGMESLLYTHFRGGAPERDFIQSFEFNVHPFITQRQVTEAYPLRLVPESDTLLLQYAPHGSDKYINIGEPEALAPFIAEILDNLYKHGSLTGNLDPVLEAISSADASFDLVEQVLNRLRDDVKLVAQDYLMLWADSSAAFTNGWDHPFVAAFLQLLNKTNLNFGEGDLQTLFNKVIAEADSIPTNVVKTNVEAAMPEVTAYFMHFADLAGDESALSQVRKKVKSLENANDALRAENKTLESQKKHTSVHRYVGMSAGALSAYMSVRNRDDLQDWQKIGIVAAGGALGLVPILNYVTIAATPFLVSKGIEYAQRLPSPVSSTRLIAVEEA